MRINKTIPLALVIAGVASPVFAAGVEQGESYVGGGISQLEVDDSANTYEPTAVIGRLGYGIADNLAVEGRLGVGLTDDSQVDQTGIDVEVDLDALGGVYGVGYAPLNETVALYGLVGLTAVGVDATTSAGTDTFEETEFSYGVGLQGDVNDRFSAYIEYVDYVDGTDQGVDFEVTGVTVGTTYRY